MESRVEQLERLLKEGGAFTFANFSIRGDRQLRYGGEDSPEWHAWKVRVCNTIEAALEKNSAPVALLKRAMEIGTAGNGEDKFVLQKSTTLAAVQQTIQIMQDDVFGESKRARSASSSGVISNRAFVVHGHD